MEKKLIKEGKAELNEYVGKISKELDVFYNPKMESNRDISVLFMKAIENLEEKRIYDKHLKEIRKVHLPLSASGIRGIRIIKECKKEVYFNDYSKEACNLIKENLKMNQIKSDYHIDNLDANQFFLNYNNFDYVDIDPYGSPNPFLDSILQKLKYGFLAVTATDTAPLCGSYINMCKRKYWANPLYNELMHEVGLRILIRKVQLVAAQYFKGLIPMISYYKDHYFRVIFFCIPTKTVTDKILKMHSHFGYNNFEIEKNGKYGPMYFGKLNDKELLKEMIEQIDSNISKDTEKFLKRLYSEVETVGFYHLHKICEKYKIKSVPKIDKVMNNLSNKASRTTFSQYGIKTKSDIEEIIKVLRKN
ncbi:MAG: hypothetical protein ACOCRX_02490 [Candidatus Woesearchaeota archaeon]